VLGAGAVAAIVALPWLVPWLQRLAATGAFCSAPPIAAPQRWLALVGPLAPLAVLAALGLRTVPPHARRALLTSAGLAAVLELVALPAPDAGELSRLCGALLAAPAGVLLARGWERPLGRAAALATVLLCLPTSWLTLAAYARAGMPPGFPLVRGPDGRAWLAGAPVSRLLPQRLVAAQRSLPADTVLVLDPFEPDAHAPGRVALGHLMAPALERPLLVDLPQLQNADEPDLRARIDAVSGFWTLWRTPRVPGQRPRAYAAADALHDLRAFAPQRPLALVVSMDDSRPRLALQRARAQNVAEEDGLVLWLLPPLAQTVRR
jgi:hypothetical protein